MSRLKDEKTSNGDRIRAMTDEVLASYLALTELTHYPQSDITEELNKSHNKWLDWLKQGVDDGEIH